MGNRGGQNGLIGCKLHELLSINADNVCCWRDDLITMALLTLLVIFEKYIPFEAGFISKSVGVFFILIQ